MYIIIDGHKYEFEAGEKVIEVARRNGVNIPSLCYMKGVEHLTSCFVCVVKNLKTGRFLPSCSMLAEEGLELESQSIEIQNIRKNALELLLSEHDADCFSPCKTSCPAGIDVRDYIALARDCDHSAQAYSVIRRKNPLVSTVGRVCPAFCEKECSRNFIDETVNIRLIKRFIADRLFATDLQKLIKSEKSERQKNMQGNGEIANGKIAIVGSGPCGLSAAYYLGINGFDVEVFEEQKLAGGMLRYSIPSYRLPWDFLDKEIYTITQLGVSINTNTKITDLSDLSKKYDAVLVAIGSWKESALKIGEQNYENIFPAVNYLKRIADGEKMNIGSNVIVIGGGNSAIDSARVSLRHGAKNVKIVYRRTRAQMPANKQEIIDALEEGVEILELLSPVEFLVSSEGSKKADKIKLQKMVLTNELDASGRKIIKASEHFEIIDFDTAIYAVGQTAHETFKGVINYDGKSYKADSVCYTGTGNIFVSGDARTGISTVIEAVADGRRSALGIIEFVQQKSFDIQNKYEAFTSRRYRGRLVSLQNQKIKAEHQKHHDSSERINSYVEVEKGYDCNTGTEESKRCINCGCNAVTYCDLRKYSIEYGADPSKYKKGFDSHLIEKYIDESLMFLTHESSKCIKCGRCIAVCSTVVGADALSFVNRGFKTFVSANPDGNLKNSSCVLCGMCIDVCPTGAFSQKLADNAIWTSYDDKIQKCKGCILECNINYSYNDGTIIKAKSCDTPICSIGRWGWIDNYSNPAEYYRFKINSKQYSPYKNQLASLNDLHSAELILMLGYNPSGDNPRMYYELKKLYETDANIETVFAISDILEDLLEAESVVAVYNYFDHDVELVKHVLKQFKGIKLLPVHYRV